MTEYSALLDQVWADHLSARADDAPTVVSTFAGCGGSSLGYSAVGFRELLAVEWDSHAAECFRRNFPDTPLYEGDITDFNPETLDIPVGSLDVLDGSPPCQGFSMNGSRRLDDPRNQLFREFVRMIDAWQPKIFVMENVKGLTTGPMRRIFVQIMEALRKAGTGYRVECRMVQAELLGVPQRRHRVVFIGTRDDLGLAVRYPAPQYPVRNTRDAFADLIDTPGIMPDIRGPKMLSKQQSLMASVMPGANGSQTLHRNGKGNSYFNLSRCDWNLPSRTIVKEMRIGMHLGVMLHPSRHRILGSNEMSRLQSFPDQYDWGEPTGDDVKDYTRIVNRIGNSVPPLMMRAIAMTIAEQLVGMKANR